MKALILGGVRSGKSRHAAELALTTQCAVTARRFADEAGTLHQQLAAVCDTVRLMVAGLPLRVKPAAEVSRAP